MNETKTILVYSERQRFPIVAVFDFLSGSKREMNRTIASMEKESFERKTETKFMF